MGEKERLVLRLATQEVECVVEVERRLDSSTLQALGDGPLGANEVAEARVRCDGPIVVECFNDIAQLGRFVLVQGFDVVAGGIVT